MAKKTVKITLKKSPISSLENHKACVRGLGLKKMHQSREVEDTPENRGMINKIRHMLLVEEA